MEGLHLVMEESSYGAYVTEIGSLKNGTDGGYIMIYTTASKDCYEGGPTVTYEGTTLGQSGFGLSQMSVKDGTVILFRLEVYEF